MSTSDGSRLGSSEFVHATQSAEGSNILSGSGGDEQSYSFLNGDFTGVQDADDGVDYDGRYDWLGDDMFGDTSFMLHGLTSDANADGGASAFDPGPTSSIHSAGPLHLGDTIGLSRIVELEDDGEIADAPALATRVLEPELGTEHPRAALGLVGPPGLDKIPQSRPLLPRSSPETKSLSGDSSSWIITTPKSSEDASQRSSPWSLGQLPILSQSPQLPGAEQGASSRTSVQLVGCSRVWVVPKVRHPLHFVYILRKLSSFLHNAQCRRNARRDEPRPGHHGSSPR